jgi:hypothetical protein
MLSSEIQTHQHYESGQVSDFRLVQYLKFHAKEISCNHTGGKKFPLAQQDHKYCHYIW